MLVGGQRAKRAREPPREPSPLREDRDTFSSEDLKEYMAQRRVDQERLREFHRSSRSRKGRTYPKRERAQAERREVAAAAAERAAVIAAENAAAAVERAAKRAAAERAATEQAAAERAAATPAAAAPAAAASAALQWPPEPPHRCTQRVALCAMRVGLALYGIKPYGCSVSL